MSVSRIKKAPIDVLSQIEKAFQNQTGWKFEKISDIELSAIATQNNQVFHFLFYLSHDTHSLHIACALDEDLPAIDAGQMASFVTLVNQRLWLGHFGMCAETTSPNFSYTMLLKTDEVIDPNQIRTVTKEAINELPEFYQTVQKYILESDSAPSLQHELLDEVMGCA